MGQVVLLVVAAAWAAVLLPPLLRSRLENRPNSSVLDFRNLTEDPADHWLGPGVAEGLVAQLAGVEGLRLVPRAKVLQARAAFAGPS